MPHRFRLRYQAIDFVLGEKPFVTGREGDCDLVLDDGLVSRQHATFCVLGDAVELIDLGSRNGVAVNGTAITGAALLQPGDRIRIGSQELVLVREAHSEPETGTAELVRCPDCSAFLSAGQPCPTCSHARVKAAAAPPLKAREHAKREVGVGSTLLADKALGLGRYDEAERLLAGRLSALLASAVPANDLEPAELKIATSYALKLAEGLQKPSWLDYPFDLYGGALQLMPAETIEELYRVAARVRYVNPHALRRYVTELRAANSTWGASERFLLLRLDGLERRIVSG
jgi:pSer/pThr/pTyr-binding forkhead associated (FHA) protein